VFDWDEHNSVHIERHNLSQEDAEDALLDPRRIGTPAHDVGGEERRAIIGATSAGRIIVVVVTKRHGLIRVVTARDADDREKRRYRGRGK